MKAKELKERLEREEVEQREAEEKKKREEEMDVVQKWLHDANDAEKNVILSGIKFNNTLIP